MDKRILTHFFLITLSLLTLVPLWIMFTASFMEHSGSLGSSSLIPDFGNLTFKNYFEVWNEGNFGRYFFNSVVVTIAITGANLIFDSMAAYALARRVSEEDHF